ncbi:MAG: choice-of-anchor V domain-containing protein [Bacteroidota bacterium]
MKKQLIAVTALLFTLGLSVQQIISNPTGTPLQASGGPAEGGATCFQAGCHFGAPSTVTDIITTDVPVAGYTPGTTYNITATVAGSGAKGLMVSAQNAGGSHLGTLISGSGSKIVFSSKYLTHTSAKTTATGIWTFKWTAPAAGSGAVTLYGAFAITQNTTRKQELTIQENTTTGVEEVNNGVAFTAYPNPVLNHLTLSLDILQSEHQTITLVSVDGKKSKLLFDGTRSSGKQEASFDVSDMENGLYLIHIISATANSYQKVLINK